MKVIFDTFVRLGNSFIEAIIRPNPKLVTDKVSQEFDDKRNKTFVIIHLFLVLGSIIDIVVNPDRFASNVYRLILLMLHFTMLHISCRLGKHIFKIYYSIICVSYGLGLIDTGAEGIHTALLSVHMVPLFAYVALGGFQYFIAQTILQTIVLNYYYPSYLEKAVTYTDPREFTRAMIYATNFTTIFFVALVLVTHLSMQHAYQRITTTEKKKDEYETQKTFLLSFSHELRNLINSLIGNVKLASLDNLTERTQELLLNAEVCGELLLHLVNNILDTGKVEIGELEINPAPTKIYDTLEKIWGVCSELIKRRGLKGTMKIQNDMPQMIMIDHYRLTQILLNLVGNAIKFTERGFIEIQVEWLEKVESVDDKCFLPLPYNDEDDQDEGLFEKKQLFSVLNKDTIVLSDKNRKLNSTSIKAVRHSQKGVLKVTVRDSGCGMSKDEINQLFQKFTQITTDVSKRKLGTGLGLFISKQICNRSGGDIRAYSKKNKETSFVFCLPGEYVRVHKEHVHDVKSIQEICEKRNLKAMLVDDVAFNHTIVTKFLEKFSIGVADVAENGSDAVTKYKKLTMENERPSIITMDLEMPVMDGKEASALIRQFETEKRCTPSFLIIISGNCTESEIKECLDPKGRIRADAFLKKPISIEDLARAVGSGLERF